MRFMFQYGHSYLPRMAVMLEQRPTLIAPVLLLVGLVCVLGAPWLPMAANGRMVITALGIVGAALAAGPAWRWTLAARR